MFSIAHSDAEERVDHSLVEILKLMLGQESWLKISKLNFGQDFELNSWSRLWNWDLVKLLKLKFGLSASEAEFWSTCGNTWTYFGESTQPLGPLDL